MVLFAPVPQETLFEEMKRYVRLTDADADVLAELRGHALGHMERIAEEFYERIREHEGANDVFTGEEQVDRLKRSLVRWMKRVLGGPYDEAYFSESSKIGRMHVRVGLPQHYMLTAMALIRIAFEHIADASMGHKAAAARDAISRALDLELAIMLESYRDDFVARAQRSDRLASVRGASRGEDPFAKAFELARVLIIGLDGVARIRLFNREAEQVTGYGREEVVGLPFVGTLLPAGLRDEQEPIFIAGAAGTTLASDVLESALRTKAGKIRDVRWQLAYAPADVNDDIVLFAVGQDTTEQKALAARVLQSEKLAAVGTLAAGLAHEIRNPLNGAHLHITFLERGLKRAGLNDPEAIEAMKIVGEEITRLSSLVTEFLDFARPKPLATKIIGVRQLCERCGQVVAASAAAAGCELRLDLPLSDIEIEVDAAKMEQVLLNLLHNAIDAMAPLGGGICTLRARRQPRFAILEVEDEGPGLTNPDAPIFDPFFSTKPQGTGLGLSIVHRIVTDHLGTIEVTSKPGRTIFRVTLPLKLTG